MESDESRIPEKMSDDLREQLFKEMRADIKAMREVDIPSIRNEITALKVKAAGWGAGVSALISAIIGAFLR